MPHWQNVLFEKQKTAHVEYLLPEMLGRSSISNFGVFLDMEYLHRLLPAEYPQSKSPKCSKPWGILDFRIRDRCSTCNIVGIW